MKLEDLVDLEAQIAVDADRAPELLRERDRALFRDLQGVDPDDRDALLTAWLRALRGDEPSLGRRVAGAYRLLSYGLVVLGALLGWTTATVLLAYSGDTPINVANFLLVVVGVQLALLAGLLVGLPLLRAFPGLPLVSDLRAALRWTAGLLERAIDRADDRLSPELREAWRAGRARLRARASLYGDVERHVLLGLTQTFGVAFNVAVLCCCLRLIVFHDLAFAWSTTLQVEPARFHRIVRGLATPWGWALPDAVPTLELVEATRYSRLDARYAGALAGRAMDAQAVGGWWPFLVAATVTYGLLPRALLLAIAWAGRARALGRLPLDAPDVDRVVRRLRAPLLETRAAARAADAAAPPPVVPPGPARPAIEPAPVAPTAGPADAAGQRERASVVLWRDLPTPPAGVASAIAASLGLDVATTLQAGGRDVARDQAACRSLAGGDDRVLVLAEGWEAPDRGVRVFLSDLRAALGPRRPVLVLLVDEANGGPGWAPARPTDVALWRDRLALLEDNYLGVEPLEAKA